MAHLKEALERIGDKLGRHEVPAGRYLESLAEADKVNVIGFSFWVRNLPGNINKQLEEEISFALVAVGSLVRPEWKRHHSPRDIDLRVLNSAPTNSLLRRETNELLESAVTSYLAERRESFKYEVSTVSEKMVEGYSYDSLTNKRKKELQPFIDWYNNDPSFIVNNHLGLPLHISVSGVNNLSLDEYLRRERRANNYFCLLTKL